MFALDGKAKIASDVAQVMEGASKVVMLTAMPLRNRLDELYGLVSVFNPDFFGSLDAFRARYVDGSDEYGNEVFWVLFLGMYLVCGCFRGLGVSPKRRFDLCGGFVV